MKNAGSGTGSSACAGTTPVISTGLRRKKKRRYIYQYG
jgi:hypothetical protein